VSISLGRRPEWFAVALLLAVGGCRKCASELALPACSAGAARCEGDVLVACKADQSGWRREACRPGSCLAEGERAECVLSTAPCDLASTRDHCLDPHAMVGCRTGELQRAYTQRLPCDAEHTPWCVERPATHCVADPDPWTDGAASRVVPAPRHVPDRAALAVAASASVRREPPSTFTVDPLTRAALCDNREGVEGALSLRFAGERADDDSGTPTGPQLGVRVFGVRSESLGGRLGLENGDRLEAIDEIALDSPASETKAVARLCAAAGVTVHLSRRDKPVDLSWRTGGGAGSGG
jgi:hypothetical protein